MSKRRISVVFGVLIWVALVAMAATTFDPKPTAAGLFGVAVLVSLAVIHASQRDARLRP